jgi:hypothetical protein
MVKTCVQMLNEGNDDRLMPLTKDNAERMMEGVRDELREADATRVNTEGE